MRLTLLSVLAVLIAVPADAQSPSQKACNEFSRQAGRVLGDNKNLWEHFRAAADVFVCRKSWMSRTPGEWAGCAVWSVAKVVGNNARGKWNGAFARSGGNNEWATWGPRAIDQAWEEGTIRGGFKRAFFMPGLPDSTIAIDVEKLDGKARAAATLCVLDFDFNVDSMDRVDFDKDASANTVLTLRTTPRDARIIGVVVDTPPSVNSFKYRLRATTTENNTTMYRPVRGIADLHLHQFANLGFGGRMTVGQHDGPPSIALAPEQIQITPGLPATLDAGMAGRVMSMLTPEAGVDANILLWLGEPHGSEDGRFYLGGGGAPNFARWPRHFSRSHHMAYVDWLNAARRDTADEVGLKLIVVSIVHNEVLCNVFKVADPSGNVPRVVNGAALGWESANYKCNVDENIQRQIEAAHEMERTHSWYRIAMSPGHARKIISEGGLAVVLSIETDKVLADKGGMNGDWRAQLDRYRTMGVTTLQPVHESDSRFIGAAPHRNMMGVLQAVNWPMRAIANQINSRLDPNRPNSWFNLDARGMNRLGLTEEGRALMDLMADRGMPIDLAHMSERGKVDVFAWLDRRRPNYGYYDSHTKFGRLLGQQGREREQEFVISEAIISSYTAHQVLLGLRPASLNTLDAPRAWVPNDCSGSAKSFAQYVQYANDHGLPIAYGTDMNGGVGMVSGRFGREPGRCWAASSEIQRMDPGANRSDQGRLPARATTVGTIAGTNYYFHGLAHIGWLPEMTRDLLSFRTNRDGQFREYGADRLRDGAEAYLDMWDRAWAYKIR